MGTEFKLSKDIGISRLRRIDIIKQARLQQQKNYNLVKQVTKKINLLKHPEPPPGRIHKHNQRAK